MLLRLSVIVVAFAVIGSAPAGAQTQPQMQTLGSPYVAGSAGPKPKPSAAEEREKRKACLEQAKQQPKAA